ncbi:Twist-related protein 1 [Trachymyrmex septentrionalis]|uniref:Twist-related protein 1 n=1 Tax=Trachymyrmex septentrionalis TaxID=34720 RepID=A0A195FVX5_9HYME|nr:Twist-related protein 1 [Trachymyrmex septentrionalis]
MLYDCLFNKERRKISVSVEKGDRSTILATKEIAASPSNYMAHERLSYAFSVWRMEGDWTNSNT